MNTRELDFAYKVRHVLNGSLDTLPAATADRLASARKTALSRKKKESSLLAFIPRILFADQAGSLTPRPLSWLPRMGVTVPLIVLALGLIGIYQVEQERRISDTAELDAAVLADELPLSAYLDHGFNAFLVDGGN